MFETFKYKWNVSAFRSYTILLAKSLSLNNKEFTQRFYQRAVDSGKGAIKLSKRVGGISADETGILNEALGLVEELYQASQEKDDEKRLFIGAALERRTEEFYQKHEGKKKQKSLDDF